MYIWKCSFQKSADSDIFPPEITKVSEPFRVAERIRKSSIEFLCVLDHLIKRRLTLVDQLVELAQLAILHLNVETGPLPFSL